MIELDGDGSMVPWTINTDSEYIQLQQATAHDIRKFIGPKIRRFSGRVECDDKHRLVFRISPTDKAWERLRNGDFSPIPPAKIVATAPGDCGEILVKIEPVPCNEETLKAKAAAKNTKSPPFVCFVSTSTGPQVADASQLPVDPDSSVSKPVLTITVTVRIAVNKYRLFECPDCCCEYFGHGFAWIDIKAQWVKGTKGAAKVAQIESEKLANFFDTKEFAAGLTDVVKARFPTCSRSKECPGYALPEITETSLAPDAFSAFDVAFISGQPAPPSSSDIADDATCAKAAALAYAEQIKALPSGSDLVTGSFDRWFTPCPAYPDLVQVAPGMVRSTIEERLRKFAPQLIATLPSLISYALIVIYRTELGLSIRSFDIVDSPGTAPRRCWCVVPNWLRFSVRGEAIFAGGKTATGSSWDASSDAKERWLDVCSSWNSENHRRLLLMYPYAYPFPCFATKHRAQQYVDGYAPGAARDAQGRIILESASVYPGPLQGHIFMMFDGANRQLSNNWVVARLFNKIDASDIRFGRRYYGLSWQGDLNPWNNDAIEALKTAYHDLKYLFNLYTNWICLDETGQNAYPLHPRVHIVGYSRGAWIAFALAQILNLGKVELEGLDKQIEGKPFTIDGYACNDRRFTAEIGIVNVNEMVLVDTVRKHSGIKVAGNIPWNVEHLYHLYRNKAKDDTRFVIGDWSNLYDLASYNTDTIVGPPVLMHEFGHAASTTVESKMIDLPPAPSDYNKPKYNPDFVCNHCYLGDAKEVEDDAILHLRARGVPI